MKLQGKSKRNLKYILGAITAFIVLVSWITYPLMQNSSWDTSVPDGNPFRTKAADLRSFDSALPYESGAPGAPLSGELTVNPSTSGEEMNSSLYSSGLGALAENEAEDSSGSDVSVAAKSAKNSSNYSPSVAAPSVSKGKLSVLPSLTGSNPNSQTIGGRHGKFFGGGSERVKFANYVPNESIGKINKGSKLLASVKGARDKSIEAANLQGQFSKSRSGAASAFNKLVGAKDSELATKMEESAAHAAGLLTGETAGNLKKNDPRINKHDVQLPKPKKSSINSNDEKYKQMIIKMLISATLGPMFGAIGQVMSATIMTNVASDKAAVTNYSGK